MWLRCEWGPSWRAFMSSTMRWRNGLIVRLVIETASLVEVDTSIFRKAFAGPLRRSHRRTIMLDPGRAPHQSIAERFSALATGSLDSRSCKKSAYMIHTEGSRAQAPWNVLGLRMSGLADATLTGREAPLLMHGAL